MSHYLRPDGRNGHTVYVDDKVAGAAFPVRTAFPSGSWFGRRLYGGPAAKLSSEHLAVAHVLGYCPDGDDNCPTYGPPSTTTGALAVPNSDIKIHTTASALRIVLGATAPFAAAVGYGLPAIEAVQLAAGNGLLTAAATNRYVIGYARRRTQTDTPVQFLLNVSHADAIRKALARSLKERGRDFPVLLFVSVEGSRRCISVDFEPHMMRFEECHGASSAPDLKKIIDEAVQPGATPAPGPVGLNPSAFKPLIKAAKYVDEGTPMRWSFGDEMKPARVELDDWFIGLVMPVRLSERQKPVECVIPTAADQDESSTRPNSEAGS